MMGVRQFKSLRLSIAVSILLHTIVFFSIIWIKLDNEYNIGEKIPVTLLKSNKTKLLRRSMPARAIPSLNILSQSYSQRTTVKIKSNQVPSPVIFVDKAFPKLYSGVESLPYEIPKNINGKMTYHITLPLTVKVRDVSRKPTSTNTVVLEGYKFLDDTLSILEKPKIRIAEDNSEILRQFLTLIRKKIESKKKYPMSARNAGIEGSSEVKMTILKDGQLEKVEIIDSSGSEVLDNAAIESIRGATPFPPIPPNLKRDKIEMSILLVFKIG